MASPKKTSLVKGCCTTQRADAPYLMTLRTIGFGSIFYQHLAMLGSLGTLMVMTLPRQAARRETVSHGGAGGGNHPGIKLHDKRRTNDLNYWHSTAYIETYQ